VRERATSLGRAPLDELEMLDDLAGAIEDNAREERLLARRVRRLRAERASGRSWHALLAEESAPAALRLAATVVSRVTEAGARFRRTVARGLRLEGATVPAIAAAFGVSHQRVSVLLRGDAPAPGPPGPPSPPARPGSEVAATGS
jgi:hypothetical protein